MSIQIQNLSVSIPSDVVNQIVEGLELGSDFRLTSVEMVQLLPKIMHSASTLKKLDKAQRKGVVLAVVTSLINRHVTDEEEKEILRDIVSVMLPHVIDLVSKVASKKIIVKARRTLKNCLH